MKWPIVPLHKVAYLESGFGFPRDFQGDPNQEFPFFRVSDMNLEGNEVFMFNYTNTVSSATLSKLGARGFPEGTVIFPKIGAAIATEKKRILTKSATYDNNVMGAVPKECVHARFLYYWFLRLKLTEQANPGHVPSIRKSVMEQIPFELPTVSEQHRIVKILDEADRLRRLRREADAKATRILPALFLKMFGDPATNPRGWPLHEIREFVKPVSRRNPMLKPEQSFQYLDISGVDGGQGVVLESKQILGKQAPSRARQEIKWHDVVVSTVRPYLRATALVPQFLDGQIASTGFCVLRSCPGFGFGWLYALTRQIWFTEKLNIRARGASYPAVTDSDIFSLIIPLPNDESLLREFDIWITDIEILREQTSGASNNIESLFNLLLEHAFSGQLTAKWREAHSKELLAEMEQQARLLNLPLPKELELGL